MVRMVGHDDRRASYQPERNNEPESDILHGAHIGRGIGSGRVLRASILARGLFGMIDHALKTLRD
jgi:hypothetical protein